MDKDNRMICFYHKSDFDGLCSGAIIKYVFPKCIMIGVEYYETAEGQKYYDSLELALNGFKDTSIIFVCDFCFSIDFMQKIEKNCDKLYWIDHHISSIKEAESLNFNPLGIRDISNAACINTWKTIFPECVEIPLAVRLLGAYDIFDLKDRSVVNFQYGMKSRLDFFNFFDNIGAWVALFEDDIRTEWFIGRGKIIHDYVVNLTKEVLNNYYHAYLDDDTPEGIHSYCLNASVLLIDSEFLVDYFKGLKEKIKILLVYTFIKDQYVCRLQALSEDIDVSVIAKRYGGGGHKAVAGFSCKDLPCLNR